MMMMIDDGHMNIHHHHCCPNYKDVDVYMDVDPCQ